MSQTSSRKEGAGGRQSSKSQAGRRKSSSGGRGRRRSPTGLKITPEIDRAIRRSLPQGRYVVFDIETTGGNPEKNGITEIFALKYHGGEIEDTFYSLVNPGISIPPIVRRMTGINNRMVRNAPRIDKVMPDFLGFIGSDVLVSHNTIGDMKFLRHFAKQVCNQNLDNFYLCTHLLVEKLVQEAPDKSLTGLAKFFRIEAGDLHRAEADTYVTLELFKVLLTRLKERSIRKIDEAIRMQGDLESGMRLGWGIDDESLKNVPHGPGVFYLYDHERKLLFVSSAVQLDKEIAKLKIFNQLPRQLLRLVLRSYDIQFQRSANPFAAMLTECEALLSHSITFDPTGWHQRTIQAIYISEDAGSLRLGVGPLVEGTKYAYGPIRDRKLAGSLLARIAEVFGVKATRKGVILPRSEEKVIVAFMEGFLGSFLKDVQKQLRSIKLLLRPSHHRELRMRAKLLSKLLDLKHDQKYHSLLDTSGVIMVSGKQTGEWQLHHVVSGRPRSMTTVRGEPQNKLKTAGYGRRIQHSIQQEKLRRSSAPLSSQDVAKVNATLWWIYNSRAEGKFIPADQISD